jgi:anthranilate phosphoribosyltransferase
VHRFIKAVGSGQKRARDLSRDEACTAMSLVADGQARPEQVGAFLLALRMKGEAAAELAGFVDALAARSDVGGARAPADTLDVDCHGDGHDGHPTLLPAAACALAALGVPTLLRLQLEHAQQRHDLVPSLQALGLDVTAACDGPRAARALADVGVAALDLPRYCPPLAALVALRPLFGVRTVAQTLMKLLDPLAAGARAVGVFHAPYLPSTAAALVDRAGPSLCVQALGGLPEAAPGKIIRVCRPGAAPETLDLRPLTVGPEDADATGPRANLAALDGAPGPARRAAAAAALLLYAARGTPPLIAAEQALATLRDGRARAVAARLRHA